jgi:DNA-binding GntR family transcriptional regulator
MSQVAGDPAAVGEIDIAFHELLVHLAASPRLTRMHKTLITETRMCIHALEATYSGAEARVDEHRQIAEAILAGDHLQADDLLAAHMDDAISRLTTQ